MSTGVSRVRCEPNNPEGLRAMEWFRSTYTGVSSLTIWSVMTGLPVQTTGVPKDLWDFGRCYRLLETIPEWKPRLREVAIAYQAWVPFVLEWDALTTFYEEYKRSGLSPDASDAYNHITRIIGTCLRRRTSPSEPQE